ncbi:hypothetical protein [Streptomyces otsuchiensis]|uniref:hypothetical protein n=1 Tax=Streptomyces otsuchiensis TaxID=2681388 RepID=UPI00103156B3|nr:hypothetical protein [Streptomyces otsuchiensis]
MTILVLPLVGLVLGVLGPLLATAVAVLADDPARRADARQVLCLLLARPLLARRRPSGRCAQPFVPDQRRGRG